MIVGGMTEVHTLNDVDLAKMYLHASYGDMDVQREVTAELHRRWPFLAGWSSAACRDVTGTRFTFGALMSDYLAALTKIAVGEESATVFASMAPPR